MRTRMLVHYCVREYSLVSLEDPGISPMGVASAIFAIYFPKKYRKETWLS